MPVYPRIVSLATAVPPHRLSQAEVTACACRLFDRESSEIERLLGVYANSGIESRYSCVPLEWYETPRGLAEKNRLFLSHAPGLLECAAERCLALAGISPDDIDGIVVVSTTGIATPSLDALLMERMPFRRDCWRLPVFGLGCAGGALGLARAAALARAHPGAKILYVVVELCALTFRRADQSKSNIVATALFGDGATAAILSCEGEGPGIAAWGEHMWPNTLDVMGWHVEDDGLGVTFSKDIPALVRANLRQAAETFLIGQRLRLADLEGFICHPGGAKVIDALEDAFGVPRGSMAEARDVLREYGNMSAATVMFVLRRVLDGHRRGRHLLSALGPGFTAGFVLLDIP
jgi:alkylresorcinol/alkylpyrone synthase